MYLFLQNLFNKTAVLFFFLAVFLTSTIFSQDVIYKKDNQTIQASLIEVTDSFITYRHLDTTNSKIKKIFAKDLNYVLFKDGRFKTFQYVPDKPVADQYFLLSGGIGQNYGGVGAMMQYRWKWIAPHFGGGYTTYAPVLMMGGVKFFPLWGMPRVPSTPVWDIYLNPGFGTLGVNGTYRYNTRGDIVEVVIDGYSYGPVFTVGLEPSWWVNDFLKIGLDGGIGFFYLINGQNKKLGLAYNIAISFVFVY